MEHENEKNFTFFRFEDLRIYHKSLDYVNWVNEVASIYPENNIVLRNKFLQCSYSITHNISEGSARNKSQFIYYLKMAKSDVRECLIYTTISFNQGLISEIQESESRGQLMEMTKMIGALISSLQRSSNYKDQHDDQDQDQDEYKKKMEVNSY